MRTRDEIEGLALKLHTGIGNKYTLMDRFLLEVLLDIRDLLITPEMKQRQSEQEQQD